LEAWAGKKRVLRSREGRRSKGRGGRKGKREQRRNQGGENYVQRGQYEAEHLPQKSERTKTRRGKRTKSLETSRGGVLSGKRMGDIRTVKGGGQSLTREPEKGQFLKKVKEIMYRADTSGKLCRSREKGRKFFRSLPRKLQEDKKKKLEKRWHDPRGKRTA